MPYYIEDKNTTFVNPYNFVPLEENCRKDVNYFDRKKEGKLTGWINCTMETKTPIFIPNTTSVEENQDGEKVSDVFQVRTVDEDGNDKIVNSYDFYSYENLKGKKNPDPPEKPVIPGSEIRGAIRAAFEAVTNSCLSTIDSERPLYKRTVQVGKPGILRYRNGNWEIQPCKRIGIAISPAGNDRSSFKAQIARLKEGQRVFVRIGGRYRTRRGFPAFDFVEDIKDTRLNNNYKEGYFHIGEFFERKHHESIFIVKNEQAIAIDKKTVENLLENFKLFQDKKVNLHYKKGSHHGYTKIGNASSMKISDLNGKLVYYAKYKTWGGQTKYYLSPAAIGREVFHNRLADIIGDYTPCNNLENLCPACALFGLVADKNSAASRVRFADAICEGTPAFEDPVTLKELAAPKISATEFYLKKQSNQHDLWNYDYAGKWERIQGRWQFSCFADYFPKIRGRKFYWHKRNGNYAESPENVSERNVHVRPLKKGNTFSFKVYFNNITEKELNTLIWVLEIGGSDAHAHKIGMGKPIGQGSVQIRVKDLFIRELKDESDRITYRLRSINNDDLDNETLMTTNQQILAQFKSITNFDKAPDNVCYPYNNIPGEKETYKWFVANRQISTSQMRPKIYQELPEVSKDTKKTAVLYGYKLINSNHRRK